MLFEELADIKWDAVVLSEASRTDEAYATLKGGHVLFCRSLAEKREIGVRFLDE